MKVFRYEDFNEAYFGINKQILLHPETLDYNVSTMGCLENVYITCKSPTCDEIDLGALGYSIRKWSHLIGTYLRQEKIQELQQFGEKVSGLSVGFDFLRKTTGNGACMLSIVLGRSRRKAPWTRATIIWRTTELQRRWAADLLLIHRMLELIPNTNIQQIDLYMTTAYQSAMYIIPLLEPVFNLTIDELDTEDPYIHIIQTRMNKYYIPDSTPHNLLASGDRMVKLYKNYQEGIIPEAITIEDCHLI